MEFILLVNYLILQLMTDPLRHFPLWTAVVTPLNDYAEVDFESLESVLKEQEIAGNGVLILGSTGEGLNLNQIEKQEIVKFTKALDLVVPVMVGISGFDLERQIKFIQFCDEYNVDAFLLVNPMYAKPGKEGQYIWFRSLMIETDTPCMIYNVPSRTGNKMSPEVPARLFNDFGNYLGLKEASGSIEDFNDFYKAEPKAPLYCGDDILIREFIDLGAIGHVSVASNVWPKKTHKYVHLALQGNTKELFNEWVACTSLLFKAPNPIPVKSLLFHKGWINSDQVKLPLVREDLTREIEEALIEADRLLNMWGDFEE